MQYGACRHNFLTILIRLNQHLLRYITVKIYFGVGLDYDL